MYLNLLIKIHILSYKGLILIESFLEGVFELIPQLGGFIDGLSNGVLQGIIEGIVSGIFLKDDEKNPDIDQDNSENSGPDPGNDGPEKPDPDKDNPEKPNPSNNGPENTNPNNDRSDNDDSENDADSEDSDNDSSDHDTDGEDLDQGPKLDKGKGRAITPESSEDQEETEVSAPNPISEEQREQSPHNPISEQKKQSPHNPVYKQEKEHSPQNPILPEQGEYNDEQFEKDMAEARTNSLKEDGKQNSLESMNRRAESSRDGAARELWERDFRHEMREARDQAVEAYNDNQMELMDREDLHPLDRQQLAENSQFLKNHVQMIDDNIKKFRVNEYPSADESNNKDYSSEEEYESEEYSSDKSESDNPRPSKRSKND